MSGSSELEVRFAHLLQPIRDLAQNWHIDIATELEDYLHELDSLTVHIDPSSSSLSSSSSPSSSPLPLNFAEAALLIQGSACVYSKKVEYLYSLLYATLDVVIDKAKKDGKKATSIDAQGEDGDALQEREAELLPLDDIAEAHNVDLDESSTRSYSVERRSTLMTRLPTSLSQRSSAQAGQDKSSGPRFRISDCTVHSSGALLLEGRDSLLLDSSLRRISADAPFGSPASVLREARSSLQPDPHSASPAASSPVLEIDFSEHADDIDAADDFAPFQDVVPMQHSIPSSSSPSPSSPSAIPASDSSATPGGKPAKAVRFASDGHLCDYRDVQRTSVASDPYALLDPFDSSHPTQPFKRGKTQRKYPPTAPTAGAGLFCDSAVYSLVHGEIENGNPRMPCHAEFAALFMRHTQAQRRLQRLKRKRELDDRRSSHTRAVAEDVEVGEEEEEQGEAFDPFPQPDPFDADEWDEPSSSSPSDPTPLPLALDADLSAAGRTFEELCKEHLDEYLRGADEYLQSSELTQRVREWQDKLEPILEEEDGHPSFDILEYGDRMLGSLEQHKVEEEEVVHFERAVQGVERWDVCRLFLATLQLANNGNVDILPSTLSVPSSNDSSDDCEAVGSLTVKVLSTKQRVPSEIMDELQLSRGRREEEDLQVVAREKEKMRGEEEDEEEEEEEEEVRTRKRKVRSAPTDRARALQPVDVNQQQTGRAHTRLRKAV